MSYRFRHIIKKSHVRAVLAAFFLIFLLGEWGGHSIICIGLESHDEQQSVSATDYGHEDPCQTMASCTDGKRQDQQTKTLGHDATQHNGLLDALRNLRPLTSSEREPAMTFSWADRLFRPPSPPFHPPKLT